MKYNKAYYIADTGWSYAIFCNGKKINGTERETKEECEALLNSLKH